MMHTILVWLFLTGFYLHKAKSVGISSKLDFGDDKEKIITIQSPEKLTNFEILKSEGTTVVCTTTGCNKTENEQKDVISDVLVHVKTSVNLPKSKNETLEETPDIPVVLGYGRNNPHPQYNPENPVTSRPVIYNNDRTSFSENTFVPAFQWKPQSQRKYYTPNYKQVSYENMLYIPYLEPSFHNYHYGEQPPLQYVWTPKDRAGFNPVEFKRLGDTPTWSRNQWNNKPFNTHNTQGNTGVYTTCTCHNPGLNWYPTTPTWNIQTRNQNSHIDDKLGELN